MVSIYGNVHRRVEERESGKEMKVYPIEAKVAQWFGALALISAAVCMVGPGCSPIQTGGDSGSEFSNASENDRVLDAYGSWINIDPYGDVWQPRVSSYWAPFTDGQWVLSNQGWIWDSNEPFGWLVYHYGSWDYRDDIGWYWVPSDDWSPARVQWTEFGDYIGWAPLPPPGVIRSGPWVPDQQRYWTVVLVKQFDAPSVGKHKVVRRVGDLSIGKELNSGTPPESSVIERATKRKVAQVTVERESVSVKSKSRDRVVLRRVTGDKPGSGENRPGAKNPKAEDQKPPAQPEKQEGHKKGNAADSTGTTKAPEPKR
jgi:hypothetical protein